MDSSVLVKYLSRCRIFKLPSSIDAFKKEVHETFSIHPSVEINLQYYSEDWGEHIDLVEDAEIIPGKKYRVLVETPPTVTDEGTPMDLEVPGTPDSVGRSILSPSNSSQSLQSSLSTDNTQIRVPAQNSSETLCKDKQSVQPSSFSSQHFPLLIVPRLALLPGDNTQISIPGGNSSETLCKDEQSVLPSFSSSPCLPSSLSAVDTQMNVPARNSETSCKVKRSIQPSSNRFPPSFPTAEEAVRRAVIHFSENLLRTLMEKQPLTPVLKSEFVRDICQQVKELNPSVVNLAKAVGIVFPYLEETGMGYKKWIQPFRYWIRKRKYDTLNDIVQIPFTDVDTDLEVTGYDTSTSDSNQLTQPLSNSSPCSSQSAEDTEVPKVIPEKEFSETLRRTLWNEQPLSRTLQSEMIRTICRRIKGKYPSRDTVDAYARAIIEKYPYLKEPTGTGFDKWRRVIKERFRDLRRWDHSEEVLERKKRFNERRRKLKTPGKEIMDTDIKQDNLEVPDVRNHELILSSSNSTQCLQSSFCAENTQIRVPVQNSSELVTCVYTDSEDNDTSASDSNQPLMELLLNSSASEATDYTQVIIPQNEFSEALRVTLMAKQPLGRVLQSEMIAKICQQIKVKYPSRDTFDAYSRAIIEEYPYLKEPTGTGFDKWRRVIKDWFRSKRKHDYSEEVLKRKTRFKERKGKSKSPGKEIADTDIKQELEEIIFETLNMYKC